MASRCSEEVRLKPDTTSYVASVFTRTLGRATIVVALLAAAPNLLAEQADRDRTEALARRATDRLQALHREAEHLASEETTLLGDLRKLEVERQIKTEQFRQIDARYRQTAAEFASINDRVRHLEDRDRAERPGLQAR